VPHQICSAIGPVAIILVATNYFMCVADVQAMTGSARRTVPCTVNSHPNTTQMFPVPVTARINIEPDANSGETKSVFIASVTCLLYLFVFIISQIL